MKNLKKYFNVINPKYIRWEFYQPYTEKEPAFGEIGLVVFLRTYSRFIEEIGRREKWCETVLRVVEYSMSLEDRTEYTDKVKEAENLFDKIFNLKIFPAGRTLWIAGTRTTKKSGSANFNCTFASVKDIPTMAQLFMWLLLGAGTGFSIEEKYISQLPTFYPQNKKINYKKYFYTQCSEKENTYINGKKLTKNFLFLNEKKAIKKVQEAILENQEEINLVVGDSKEGWAVALETFLILITLSDPFKINIDFDKVRPNGAPIKGFGGKASGHQNLQEAFELIFNTISNTDGILKSVNVLDILNIIGKGVVSGGVRRCLPKGTKILTTKGIKNIEDVFLADEVYSLDDELNITTEKIIDKVDQGRQEVLTIRHELGKFSCTKKHKIATYNYQNQKVIWKFAQDLEVDDLLIHSQIPLVENIYPSKNLIKEFNLPIKKNLNPEKSNLFLEKYSYLYGFLQSRFTVQDFQKSIVRLNKEEEEINEKIEELFDFFGVSVVHVNKPYKKNPYFKYLRTEFNEKFKKLTKFKKVPEYIFKSNNKTLIKKYLAGIYDGSGTTKGQLIKLATMPGKNNEHTNFKTFFHELNTLFHSLGVFSVFHKWYIETNLDDKLFESLEYSIKRKYILPSEVKNLIKYDVLKNDKFNLIPVHEIIKDGSTELTFDVTVENTKNFLIWEGFMVHNTAQIALGDFDDQDFIDAKYNLYSDPNKKKYRSYRTMSNNSVMLYERPDKEKLKNIFNNIKNNGEPGFIVIGNSKKHDPQIEGFNPCLEGDTLILTSTGIVPIKDLVYENKIEVVNDLNANVKAKCINKNKQSLLNILLENDQSYMATPEHLWKLKDGSYKMTKNLSSEDELLTVKKNKLFENKNESCWTFDDGRFLFYLSFANISLQNNSYIFVFHNASFIKRYLNKFKIKYYINRLNHLHINPNQVFQAKINKFIKYPCDPLEVCSKILFKGNEDLRKGYLTEFFSHYGLNKIKKRFISLIQIILGFYGIITKYDGKELKILENKDHFDKLFIR
jgi:ribonucleotide reductase alpha subunit